MEFRSTGFFHAFALSALLACSTIGSAFATGPCPVLLEPVAGKVFRRAIELHSAGGADGILRYPVGVDPTAHPDWHLMFGFESEYTKDESGKLLQVYGPKPEFGISPSTWIAMSPESRVDWVKQHLGSNPIYAEQSPLIKINADTKYAFLPENLSYDPTGNVELILSPVDTLEEWQSQMNFVNEEFGVGSMQGMMSTPRDPYFGNVAGGSREHSLRNNLGYLNFVHDFDVLEKLEFGAGRFAVNRTKSVAQTFKHPWLGPISDVKQARMADFLEANASGQKFDPRYTEKIRKRDGSFKYIGSTAYRPDIGGSQRISFEIRDAHKNVGLIENRMVRNVFYQQYGRDVFANFSGLKAFSPVESYGRLSARSRRMLESVFPSKAIPGTEYYPEDLIAIEVYRNFGYPMRDWSEHVRALGNPEGLQRQVEKAQRAYARKIESIAKRMENGQIDARQAGIETEGALAEFSKESGLAHEFAFWQDEHLTHDVAWNSYMEKVVRDSTEFTVAFPDDVWEGPLNQRLARFQKKWADHVQVVDNVKFKVNQSGFNTAKSRKVLAISTAGMASADVDAMTSDYAKAFARGTVSWPLGEDAGHLHTRFGTKTMDYYGWFNINEYRSSPKRLEPFMVLSPGEELNLRTYMQSAKDHISTTVGSKNYEGVVSGETVGHLDNNLPINANEGHNCTSWLCTAPIGETSGAPVLELMGATKSYNIHTSPSWWSMYVSGIGRSERVPFVAYWDNSLDKAAMTSRLQNAVDDAFQWSFNAH